MLKKWRIFDAQVQPVVLYGADIWGLESSSSVIDDVQLFALKRYWGMDRRTQMILFMEKLEGFLFKLMQVFAVWNTG